ncbi:hypothetical protein LTR85_012090 [Meristemomyces frigidus]|nr:hypothetical protein LTR85_012090 [Meristemomyces frigidus]
MSEIIAEYSRAKARLNESRKQWNDAIKDCTAFERAVVAARATVETLRDQTLRYDIESVLEAFRAAQSDTDRAQSAFAESQERVKSAEQAVAAGKANVERLQPVLHKWLDGEGKRAKAEYERVREQEQAKEQERAKEQEKVREQERAREQEKAKEQEKVKDKEAREAFDEARKQGRSPGGFKSYDDYFKHFKERYNHFGYAFRDFDSSYSYFGSKFRTYAPRGSGARGGANFSWQNPSTAGGDTTGGAERPREEKAERPIFQRPSKAVRTITVKDIQDWHQACVTAFLDKPNLRSFPEPPSEACTSATCAAEKKDRALKACKCTLRKIFCGPRDLKQDRIRFHPDRFSTCPEDVRGDVQKKAKEVFVVVDAIFSGR